MRRALGLFSGGLDSLLAARVMQAQGMAVSCLHLRTGFERADYRRSVEGGIQSASFGEAPPLALEVLNLSDAFARTIVVGSHSADDKRPHSCVDCRILMLRHALHWARQRGIELLFTGEVLGQRARDQTRQHLLRVEREAGLAGRLLRPLSAAFLPPTEAEASGLVDRSRLPRIHGRSRRAQLALAAELGISGFPTPSGGCCRLTHAPLARRVRDAVVHGGRPGADDVELLATGRHFRLAWNVKVIVGRNERESRWLSERFGEGASCQVADGHGAFGVIEGSPRGGVLLSAASLAARYSRQRDRREVVVVVSDAVGERRVRVQPATPGDLETWRI